MFFVIIEKYCKDILDCSVSDLLGCSYSGYAKYKKEGEIPLKHYKTLCSVINLHLCDNQKEISVHIVSTYFKEVSK
tara:strand:- start:1444 stop:1671 length:228 start_codon:yes stop_codon:yes gene_type:complete